MFMVAWSNGLGGLRPNEYTNIFDFPPDALYTDSAPTVGNSYPDSSKACQQEYSRGDDKIVALFPYLKQAHISYIYRCYQKKHPNDQSSFHCGAHQSDRF